MFAASVQPDDGVAVIPVVVAQPTTAYSWLPLVEPVQGIDRLVPVPAVENPEDAGVCTGAEIATSYPPG